MPFKSALGSATATTSGTTLVITTTAAIAIDDLVVVRVGCDNLNSTDPRFVVNDSGGNGYTNHIYVANTVTTGVAAGILATRATAVVSAGGTITVTFDAAVTARTAMAESWTGFANVMRQSSSFAQNSAVTSGSGSATFQIGDLCVASTVIETNAAITYDTDTIGGPVWTVPTPVVANTGVADTSVSLIGQHKIHTVAASATQNCSWTGACEYASVQVGFIPAVTPVPAFKYFLGQKQDTVSGATVVITTLQPIAVNDLVVVRVAADLAATGLPTFTCADSGGNAYTTHAQSSSGTVAASGIAGGIMATRATSPVSAGGTITVTLSNAVAARCAFAESYTGVLNTLSTPAVLGTVVSGTVTSANALQNQYDLAVGWYAVEHSTVPTGDNDNQNGQWTQVFAVYNTLGGSSSTRVTCAGQFKIPLASTPLLSLAMAGASAPLVGGLLVFMGTPTGEARLAREEVHVLRRNTAEGNALLARAEVRVLLSVAIREARLARISERQLTAGTPGVHAARFSMRSLTPLTIPTAQVARISARALVSLVVVTPPPGATARVREGDAWIDVPVWEREAGQWVTTEVEPGD